MTRFAVLKWKLVAKQKCCFYMGSDSLANAATGGRNEVKDILITKPPNPLFPFHPSHI